MAMTEILAGKLNDMFVEFVRALPALGLALVVIIVTWIVVKIAVSVAERVTSRTSLRPSLASLIVTLVKIGVWVLGLLIAAIVVFPDVTPASLFAGLGIGAVAIGFAFQDIFENFLAGMLLMARDKMRMGDVIECEGIVGKVERITLRETHLRSLSRELTVVPNSVLFKNPVEILTDEKLRRHEVVIGVSYDTDLDHAAEVIEKAVKSIDGIAHEEGLDIFAKEFNSSSIDFLVRWFAGSTPRTGWETTDKVVRGVKRALDEAGIEIPFPYITHTFKERVPIGSEPGTAV
ncbi:MAG: mechanosensitive ion channel family protein [Erythrobacter sp.]|jgi:small-conductance mechanosensitive channel|nr:mechanosensitive ion channel family protein [Erythrobacter sp.]